MLRTIPVLGLRNSLTYSSISQTVTIFEDEVETKIEIFQIFENDSCIKKKKEVSSCAIQVSSQRLENFLCPYRRLRYDYRVKNLSHSIQSGKW